MKKTVFIMAIVALCCACKAKTDLPEILREKAFSDVDLTQMSAQYKANKAEWDAACAFLSRADLDTLVCGKYVLTENGTYANVQEYDLSPEAVRRFERHQKFIDIQYVMEGEEEIAVCREEDLLERSEDYSESKDVEFFSGASKMKTCLMDNSKWVILFPTDPHMPGGVSPSGPCHIRKIVIKVLVAPSEK